MGKFKVGDIVTGNELSDDYYSYTTSEMTKGEVVSITGEYFDVKVLEHKDSEHVGRTYHGVEEEHFDLVKTVENYFVRDVEVFVEDSTILLTINNNLVIGIPEKSGVGVSSVVDGDIFVQEIGEALAFYRQQNGGSIR